MRLVRIFLLLATVLAGCSATEGRTQLTFRLDAVEPFRSRIASLQVTLRSDQNVGETKTFDDLQWPVDIVVVPALGNNSKYGVRLNAIARDEDGKNVGQIVKDIRFVPERESVVALEIIETSVITDPSTDDTPIMPSDPDDGDDDVDETPRQDGGGGSLDAGTDAGPAKQNCETRGANINCEDGNKCNGVKECRPSAAGADDLGCVTITPAPKACDDGMTCVPATGMCTACTGRGSDADGDGFDSMTCGGKDCEDGDKSINPDATEVCDGKDNDCDGETDEGTARMCDMMAPAGLSGRCGAGKCVFECPMGQTEQKLADGGVSCMTPVNPCLPNPCGAGTCMPATVGGYTCTCAMGARASVGNKFCMAAAALTTQSFETQCDGMPHAAFTGSSKSIDANYFAKCGISTIVRTGLLNAAVQLVKVPATVTGATGATVLEGNGAGTDVTITFDHLVGWFSLDLLDLDTLPAVRAAPNGAAVSIAPLTQGQRKSAVTYNGTPISSVTISMPTLAVLEGNWYIDNLQFPAKGCGDGVLDMANELCDPGTSKPCAKNCDNACRTTAPAANTCFNEAMNACTPATATCPGPL